MSRLDKYENNYSSIPNALCVLTSGNAYAVLCHLIRRSKEAVSNKSIKMTKELLGKLLCVSRNTAGKYIDELVKLNLITENKNGYVINWEEVEYINSITKDFDDFAILELRDLCSNENRITPLSNIDVTEIEKCQILNTERRKQQKMSNIDVSNSKMSNTDIDKNRMSIFNTDNDAISAMSNIDTLKSKMSNIDIAKEKTSNIDINCEKRQILTFSCNQSSHFIRKIEGEYCLIVNLSDAESIILSDLCKDNRIPVILKTSNIDTPNVKMSNIDVLGERMSNIDVFGQNQSEKCQILTLNKDNKENKKRNTLKRSEEPTHPDGLPIQDDYSFETKRTKSLSSSKEETRILNSESSIDNSLSSFKKQEELSGKNKKSRFTVEPLTPEEIEDIEYEEKLEEEQRKIKREKYNKLSDIKKYIEDLGGLEKYKEERDEKEFLPYEDFELARILRKEAKTPEEILIKDVWDQIEEETKGVEVDEDGIEHETSSEIKGLKIEFDIFDRSILCNSVKNLRNDYPDSFNLTVQDARNIFHFDIKEDGDNVYFIVDRKNILNLSAERIRKSRTKSNLQERREKTLYSDIIREVGDKDIDNLSELEELYYRFDKIFSEKQFIKEWEFQDIVDRIKTEYKLNEPTFDDFSVSFSHKFYNKAMRYNAYSALPDKFMEWNIAHDQGGTVEDKFNETPIEEDTAPSDDF